MTLGKILVWDVPTRAFHAALALAFAGAYLTSDSERLRDVHVVLGYVMLTLVAFRIVWGLLGTRYARFTAFAWGPGAVLRYLRSLLRGRPEHHIGHNPLGSWGIYVLLALTVLAGASGYATSALDLRAMEEIHEALANALLAMVGLHVAGVVVSSIAHRENLVRAMVTGYKRGEASAAIRHRHWAVGALVVALATWPWWSGFELGSTVATAGNGVARDGVPHIAATVRREDHER